MKNRCDDRRRKFRRISSGFVLSLSKKRFQRRTSLP